MPHKERRRGREAPRQERRGNMTSVRAGAAGMEDGMDGTQIRLDEIEEGAEYKAFIEKFKPKKTTDDCYTPENIYQVVADYVTETYGDKQPFVRPFWPGRDYERDEYPEGCAVVDNPPFSILSQIISFYQRRKIRFFLFAPTLTLFTSYASGACFVPCGVSITYANGADVNTSFITNMDDAQLVTAPRLYKAIKETNDANVKAMRKELPKYSYPDYVLTAAAAYQYSHYGIDWRLEKSDCCLIRALDAQRQAGKSIFGGALLLSERAAAERAAAHKWQLSDREKTIIEMMSREA